MTTKKVLIKKGRKRMDRNNPDSIVPICFYAKQAILNKFGIEKVREMAKEHFENMI